MKKIIKVLLILSVFTLSIATVSYTFADGDLECPQNQIYVISAGLTGCCAGTVEDGECITSPSDVGININSECLLDGSCSLNVYKVFGIRTEGGQNPSVSSLFEDVVLAATTFVGTVIVIALIVSGLIFAFGSISGKDTKRAKTIMIDCFVGLLLVMGSYTIIRLIQFIATGRS